MHHRQIADRLTLEKVVELVDARRDAEVDRLVTEVHNNSAEDRRVDLGVPSFDSTMHTGT